MAILAPDSAFPSFRNRYPANVPTLSAYRIILPVLWRDPGRRRADEPAEYPWAIQTGIARTGMGTSAAVPSEHDQRG